MKKLLYLALVLAIPSRCSPGKNVYVFLCNGRREISLSATLAVWQRTAGVKVTDAARALIGQQFCDNGETIGRYVEKRKLIRQDENDFLDWVVQSYLYDLRDRTIWAHAHARSLRNRTLILENVSSDKPPNWGYEVISATEVQTFPVERFFAVSLQFIFGGTEGEGHLYVTSIRDRASILINNTEWGETCRKFVLTPGHYTVSVASSDGSLSCKRDVEIRDGKTEHFSCPEKSDCSRAAPDAASVNMH